MRCGVIQFKKRFFAIQGFCRALVIWVGVTLAGMAVSMRADASAEPGVLPPAAQEVVLAIDGAILHANNKDGAAHLGMAHIRSLPAHVLHTSTTVTDGVKRFDGVLMRDVLDLVGAQGNVVEAAAYNGYVVDIPVSDFYDYEVVMATHMDGRVLELSDKGPLWIVYPRDAHRKLQDIRYDYRWVWQLNQLTVKNKVSAE